MMTTPLTLDQMESPFNSIVAAIPNAAPYRVEMERSTDGLPCTCGFTQPGEIKVHLRYDKYKHRLEVSGYYPVSRIQGESCPRTFSPHDLYNPRAESPSISISCEKSPEAIAKEIQRRFLPDYQTVLFRCIGLRDAHEKYFRDQQALAGQIGSALGTARRNTQGTVFELPRNLTKGSVYGDVDVSGDSVRFRINNVPAAQALKLAAFLRTL